MTLLTQEKLRDLFQELTGKRACTNTIRHCIIEGLPFIDIGKRKYFNHDSVLTWINNREHQSKTYVALNKQR
jgi:hypothetical protein